MLLLLLLLLNGCRETILVDGRKLSESLDASPLLALQGNTVTFGWMALEVLIVELKYDIVVKDKADGPLNDTVFALYRRLVDRSALKPRLVSITPHDDMVKEYYLLQNSLTFLKTSRICPCTNERTVATNPMID